MIADNPYYGLPVATLNQHLEAYLAAHLAIANGQEYSYAGRSLTRADLADVQNTISLLQKEILRQQGRGANSKPRCIIGSV